MTSHSLCNLAVIIFLLCTQKCILNNYPPLNKVEKSFKIFQPKLVHILSKKPGHLKMGSHWFSAFFKYYLTLSLINMDSEWLNKLQGVKCWEVIVHFDGFQNPISLCSKSHNMGKHVRVEWICQNIILIYVIYRWTLLLQIQSMSVYYHSLMKWFQILINITQ